MQYNTISCNIQNSYFALQFQKKYHAIHCNSVYYLRLPYPISCNNIPHNAISQNTLLHHLIQCNMVQYSTIPSIPCNTVQPHTISYNTVQHNITQYNTLKKQYKIIPYKAISNMMCNIIQYIQYYAIQYNTIHYYAISI